MCGIIAYVGEDKALPILVSGLERLEYRGYDSAGVAVLNGRINIVRAEGKIGNLKKKLLGVKRGAPLQTGIVGIGHTRWATHGEPSERNAHPHSDQNREFVVVQNGIFENYAPLKARLIKGGHRFSSATDTEVSAHLLKSYYRSDLASAFRKTVSDLKGYFALVAMSTKEPDRLVAYKRSNPLVVGVGKNGHYVASDVSAVLPYTRKIIYLDDEDLVVVTKDRVDITSLKTGKRRHAQPETVGWNVGQAQKGGYAHFMLKEIYEQPDVIRNILDDRVRRNGIQFDTLPLKKLRPLLKGVARVIFVSCGTAYHAGLVGRYLFEDKDMVGMSSEVNTSSEFRYYPDPTFGKKDLAVFISQSGETADSLAALKEAKRKHAKTLGIVNVVGSSIAREADAVIYTHAGPEIGVASTKAYTAQLMVITLLALMLGRYRKTIPALRTGKILREAGTLPEMIDTVLKLRPKIRSAAKKFSRSSHFLFLGRGYNFPSALEGALKLKEITYMHAHGYAAGEMKHGPIALIDRKLPVVCFAPQSKTHEKMLSNIEEIKAREGIVVAIGTEGDRELKRRSDYFFPVPPVSECLSPILCAIILQLIAYELAVCLGRDVDHPRNLAKSVTVE